MDFPLVQGGAPISGTVTDACQGLPLTGAQVFLAELGIFALTDGVGAFLIPGMHPDDRYTVRATMQNFVLSGRLYDLVGSAAPNPLSFSLVPVALAPTSIACKSMKNKFLVETDRIYEFKWEASPRGCLIGYRISRDGKEIGFIPASGPLQYSDSVRFNKSHEYSVQAINSFGEVSPPLKITVL